MPGYIPLEIRFWAKVEKTDGCWLWTGHRNKAGYAFMKRPRSRLQVGVHRIAYELANGPIPDEMTVDHLCFIRHCVNPHHLRLLTHVENSVNHQEPIEACPRGHSYADPSNVYWGGPNHQYRRCRPCTIEHARNYRARQKAG